MTPHKKQSHLIYIFAINKIGRPIIFFSFGHLAEQKNLGREMVGIAVQELSA